MKPIIGKKQIINITEVIVFNCYLNYINNIIKSLNKKQKEKNKLYLIDR